MLSSSRRTADEPDAASSNECAGVVRSASTRGLLGRRQRWLAGRAVGVVVAVALAASLARGVQPRGSDCTATLVSRLAGRGLTVDPDGVVWLEQPPVTVLRAAAGSVPVVLRARPAPDEPHDIYLVETGLSPEGVLLRVGSHFNLTQTSAVDEQAPIGGGGGGTRFAFVERSMLEGQSGARVQLLDLAAPSGPRRSAGQDAGASTGGQDGQQSGEPRLSRAQRLQAAVTRLQQTGRLDRIGHSR